MHFSEGNTKHEEGRALRDAEEHRQPQLSDPSSLNPANSIPCGRAAKCPEPGGRIGTMQATISKNQ